MKPTADDPRRRLLLEWLAAGGATAGPLLVPAGARAQGLPRPLAADQSIFRVANGRVNDRAADGTTRVRIGDTVRTGAGGEMIFVVGSTAVLARANTELRVEGDGGGAGDVLRALRVATGRVLAVFGRGTHTVRTALAQVVLTGTGFYVEAKPDETYFCTCYGAADIGAVNDPASRLSVVTKRHDRPVFVRRNASPGQAIIDAPFKDHDDAELALIEALVGRAPPFIHPTPQYEDRGRRADYGR